MGLLGRSGAALGRAQVWRLQAMPLMKAACGSRLGDLASRTPPHVNGVPAILHQCRPGLHIYTLASVLGHAGFRTH